MAKVVNSSLARKDFSEIFQYIAGETSVEQAQKFLRLLDGKCQLLAKFPEMGRARHEFLINLRSFPVKNYLIFYLPIDDGIEILRVLHATRDIKQVFEDAIDEMKKIN